MKRSILLALAVPTTLLAGKSDPGAPLIAADDAYAAAARTQGEWTATRAVSLQQTEMFVPQRVKTLEFGKTSADPKVSTHWQAEQAWISCDGTAGVTFGRWSLPGSTEKGWYETVWGKLANGNWRILLRHSNTNPRTLHSKPGRKGWRAACTGKPFIAMQSPNEGDDSKFGTSTDMTLNWSSLVTKAGEVRIIVKIWNGRDFVPVLEDVAPAPTPR